MLVVAACPFSTGFSVEIDPILKDRRKVIRYVLLFPRRVSVWYISKTKSKIAHHVWKVPYLQAASTTTALVHMLIQVFSSSSTSEIYMLLYIFGAWLVLVYCNNTKCFTTLISVPDQREMGFWKQWIFAKFVAEVSSNLFTNILWPETITTDSIGRQQ